MCVFGPAQYRRRQHRLKIGRVHGAAVRRIAYQRNRFDSREQEAVRVEIRIGKFHEASVMVPAGSGVALKAATFVPGPPTPATSLRWQALQWPGATSCNT